MASTADHPTEPPAEREELPDEMEPLLAPLPRQQPEGSGMMKNLINGERITHRKAPSITSLLIEGTSTDFVMAVQGALLCLVVLVLIQVFRAHVGLFAGHPVSMIFGFVAVVQSILILQPTYLPYQKTAGARIHAAFHIASLLAFVSGVTVIEYHKTHNGLGHFKSPHAYIGVTTCAVLVAQYFVGVTMWLVPSLYGGEGKAREVWKYHRMSGYLLLALLVASLVSATKTEYVEKVIDIPTAAVAVVCGVCIVGMIPQFSPRKLLGGRRLLREQ